jgi:hypothetical protein
MAEGNDTYFGLGVPLFGESEIKQLAGDEAVDILTLTGSTGTLTGDFLVAQTGSGTEEFVVSASGGVTAHSLTIEGVTVLSSSLTGTQVGLVLSATTMVGALTITASSSGAIATGGTAVNAIYVSGGSKSVINAVLHYNNGDNASAQTLLATSGSILPAAFLAIGSSAGYYTGAGNVSGAIGTTMFTASSSYYLTTALATTMPLALLKVLAGSKAFYIPMLTDTMITAA